ncbi:MAG: biosynthetic peptidoglycan transglycosylase [bacterium]
MSGRRLISAAVLGILLVTILVLGGRRLVFARIEAATAALPVPLEYRDARLRIFPLRILLDDVDARDGDDRPETIPSAAGPHLAGARASLVEIVVDTAALGRLLRDGVSGRAVRRAVDRVTVTEFSATASVAAAEWTLSGREAAANRHGRGGFTVDVPDLHVRVSTPGVGTEGTDGTGGTEGTDGTGGTEGTSNEAGGGGDTVPQSRTIAGVIETLFGRAVALREEWPPMRLSLGSAEISYGHHAMVLSGSIESEPGAAIMIATEFHGTWGSSGAGARTPTAALSGRLAAEITGPGTAGLEGSLAASDLTVRNDTVAPQPITVPRLRYDFHSVVNTHAPFNPPKMARGVPGIDVPAPLGAGAAEDADLRGAIRVTEGVLHVGAVRAQFRPVLLGLNAPGSAPHGGYNLPAAPPARVDFTLVLPETPLQDVVNAVPAALLGPLSDVELAGSLAWEIDAEAPLLQLSWTRWEEDSRVRDFELRAVDPAYDVRALAGAFRHRMVNEVSGYRRVVVVPPWRDGKSARRARRPWTSIPALGPTPNDAQPDPSYEYAEFSTIPSALIGAVVTAEDGEYFRHNGVNWTAITTAMEANLERGEIVLGGSTIPMQLAKNVFLDDRRVVSRKLQELGLVALANLTRAVARERILEIYLNVIEFGPNVYGIVDAADHYFGIAPSDLTVPQAVWLASIIRDPATLSAHAAAGSVPPWWLERMSDMMEIMVERDRLSPEDLAAWRGVQPVFRVE